MAPPFAAWVNEIPPDPPVCVRVKAVSRPSTLTPVRESSVTVRPAVPLALSDCGSSMAMLPLHVNAPAFASHLVLESRFRKNSLSLSFSFKLSANV